MGTEEKRRERRKVVVEEQFRLLSINQAEVCRSAQVSRSVYWRFIEGGNTTTKNLEKIAKALQVDPGVIL